MLLWITVLCVSNTFKREQRKAESLVRLSCLCGFIWLNSSLSNILPFNVHATENRFGELRSQTGVNPHKEQSKWGVSPDDPGASNLSSSGMICLTLKLSRIREDFFFQCFWYFDGTLFFSSMGPNSFTFSLINLGNPLGLLTGGADRLITGGN